MIKIRLILRRQLLLGFQLVFCVRHFSRFDVFGWNVFWFWFSEATLSQLSNVLLSLSRYRDKGTRHKSFGGSDDIGMYVRLVPTIYKHVLCLLSWAFLTFMPQYSPRHLYVLLRGCHVPKGGRSRRVYAREL